MAVYVLAFCRMVTGLVFTWSFWSKARDLKAFEGAVALFKLLPDRLNSVAAVLLLSGELGVAILMILGGPLLMWGFLLATILLFIFCVALSSVLIRKIRTSCNYFGPSEKSISPYDILRNAGFIACALGGCGVLTFDQGTLVTPGWMEWGLIGVVAVVFVSGWVNLGEIARLLRPDQTSIGQRKTT